MSRLQILHINRYNQKLTFFHEAHPYDDCSNLADIYI